MFEDIMGYAKIDLNNVTYQPRLNILQLIYDNISDKYLPIYESFPDLTARGKGKFPFILLPSVDLIPNGEYTLKHNIQYTNELIGSIYHDYTKLGDNQLRNLKSELVKMFASRTNKKTLASFGISEIDIELQSSGDLPDMHDQMRLINLPFIIRFQLDVDMRA